MHLLNRPQVQRDPGPYAPNAKPSRWIIIVGILGLIHTVNAGRLSRDDRDLISRRLLRICRSRRQWRQIDAFVSVTAPNLTRRTLLPNPFDDLKIRNALV